MRSESCLHFSAALFEHRLSTAAKTLVNRDDIDFYGASSSWGIRFHNIKLLSIRYSLAHIEHLLLLNWISDYPKYFLSSNIHQYTKKSIKSLIKLIHTSVLCCNKEPSVTFYLKFPVTQGEQNWWLLCKFHRDLIITCFT